MDRVCDKVWWVDCFTELDYPEHPAASYGPRRLEDAIQDARRVLSNPASGIVRVEIGQTTKGLSPRGS